VLTYPRGQGGSVILADFGQDVDRTEQLAQALDSPDETERGEAVQTLIEHFGTQAQDLVLRALDDHSDQVREQALYSALEAAFTLPVDTLMRLATTDPLPSVRLHAMEALASNLEGPDAPDRLRTIAEVTDRDPEASVRAEAARLFEQLTNAPTPPTR
jgi:hypothetical protein